MAAVIRLICYFALVQSATADLSAPVRRLPVVAFEAEYSQPLESLAVSEDGRQVFVAVRDAVHQITADHLIVTATADTGMISQVVVASNATGHERIVVCGHKTVEDGFLLYCRAYDADAAARSFTFIKEQKADTCDLSTDVSSRSLKLYAFTMDVDKQYENFVVAQLVVLSAKAASDCHDFHNELPNKSATTPYSKMLLTRTGQNMLMMWGQYFDIRFGYPQLDKSHFRQHFVAGFDFGTFSYLLKSYAFPTGQPQVSYITRHCGVVRRLTMEMPFTCRRASTGADYSVLKAAIMVGGGNESYILASFKRPTGGGSAICVYQTSELEMEYKNALVNCTIELEDTPYHTRIIPWESRNYVPNKKVCQRVSLRF